MANWQNFYLQKMSSTSEPVYESVNRWGVFCKEIPFALAGDMKKPAKNEWYDEHGDDEYIADGGLYMEAYTMEVEFGCQVLETGNRFNVIVEDVRANVASFLQYLRTSGMMKMYSSYTGVGRQSVRLDSYNDGEWINDNGITMLVFKIKFKVNDPVTEMVLSANGMNITER